MMIKLKKFAIVFFLMLIVLNFVKAECQWNTFGESFTPLWNEKLSPETCYGRFDADISNISVATGMSVGTQPLSFYYQSVPYLLIPNGNYLNIYSGSLALLSQKNIGAVYGQPDILDWDDDGYTNDIAIITQFNSTLYPLKVYKFDTSLTQLYSYNFTSAGNFTGLRHSGNRVLFVYDINSTSNYFIDINSSGIQQDYLISDSSTAYTQPLSWVDVDDDGVIDYMTFSTKNITIFNENGEVANRGNSVNEQFFDVKIYPICFAPPTTCSWWRYYLGLCSLTCNNEWKIASVVGRNMPTVFTPYVNVISYNLDGSSFWSKTLQTGTDVNQGGAGGGVAITDDYNGDGYADIYVTSSQQQYAFAGTGHLRFDVLSGIDGSSLAGKDYLDDGYGSQKLIIADMNHNGKYDFVLIDNLASPKLWIHDPYTNASLMTENAVGSSNYCTTSDINKDSYLEVICSYSSKTYIFSSNASNTNPTISSVTYDPSLSVIPVQTIYAYITAFDPDSDQMFYYEKCSDSDSWTLLNSSTASCSYSLVGNYNLSVGVKDFFHSNMDVFSQTAYVTTTGSSCGNLVCEGGETYTNCPADCPSTIQAEGGISIPTKIVDTENTEQGLLPEIYYGILGFFSNVLSPAIIVIFLIFFVLIILAIGSLIKKIGSKVGS